MAEEIEEVTGYVLTCPICGKEFVGTSRDEIRFQLAIHKKTAHPKE